ncbi:MAG TPA: ergothioneine biosynthesis protein EgtC [Streptosporangiaceae bacterium]|nr:ergothioneine biosynthesis protein EgtC [Streptosporangiaceae bacterium]
MCRHLAYLGSPRGLASLLLEPEHGLLRQSYAPRRQCHGTMNADGWGVGFYAATRPDEPARWRSNRPLWADASFASVAPVIEAGCVLAAVRSATAGMPGDETAAAPFQSGRWLLSHNGTLDRALLGPHPAAESVCDSAQLAAHLFDSGPERAGQFVADLGRRDPAARLNLLLTDGQHILATRWNDTLSVLRTDDGVVVASEPYDDDPRWADVPDHHLVTATADAVTLTDLET